MTIRVRIENQDDAAHLGKRVVKVKRTENGSNPEEHSLDPGQACEVHIWNGASLIVEEFETK